MYECIVNVLQVTNIIHVYIMYITLSHLYFSFSAGDFTPLHLAVGNNNQEIVKLLIQHQHIDVNVKTTSK